MCDSAAQMPSVLLPIARSGTDEALPWADYLPLGNEISIPTGHLPFGKDTYAPAVDALDEILKRRVARLLEIRNREFDGSNTALAHHLGIQPDYLSRMISAKKQKKKFGEDLARRF